MVINFFDIFGSWMADLPGVSKKDFTLGIIFLEMFIDQI